MTNIVPFYFENLVNSRVKITLNPKSRLVNSKNKNIFLPFNKIYSSLKTIFVTKN